MKTPRNSLTDASDQPRFSIIMNVLNGERYLKQAIDSVLAQTFPGWELIIWDGRSTDNSAEICAQYNDKRLRYFLSPQRGNLCQARARAMEQARGQWLAFLDQDDVWSPTKLARQSELIDADTDGKLGIVYGRTMNFNKRGKQWDFDRWHEFAELPEGDIFNELFIHTCFIAMSSAVLRKSAVEEVGGISPELEYCPDYYLYVAISQHYRTACVQEPCCWYRIHSANMSKVFRILAHTEILKIVEKWAQCIDPALYNRRKRVHETLIGLEEILSRKAIRKGLRRILGKGSLRYLLSRPFVKAGRLIRRMISHRPKCDVMPGF